MFCKAPNDFRAAIVVLFLESMAMFNFFNIIMWILTEDAGFSDRQAGILFGTYGFVVALYSVLLGSVIDRLQVRKSLLIHITLGVVSKLILGFTMHKVAVCVVLYGPFSVSMAMGMPVIPIALRRYTRQSFRTLAFAAYYVVMNVGAALSQPMVDGFRLGLAPYSGAGWMLHRPLWSFFLLCNCALHAVSIAVAWRWIHDIEVVECDNARCVEDESLIDQQSNRWPTRRTLYNVDESWSEFRAKTWKIIRSSMLWRFVLLSVSLVGAKSVYVYLISLYPLYMQRAAFPVDNPQQVPFMTFLLINPVIVIIMTYPIGALITRYQWDRFWVIVVGAVLSAGAPFFMMITQYWAVFCFIIAISISEPVWSPIYKKYTLEFTQSGEEGIFFGLATIPLFGSKLITGFLSGELLRRFCPAPGPLDAPDGCGKGYMIWMIVGCITFSSPILLLVTQRWTWLRLDHDKTEFISNDDTTGIGDDIQMIHLDRNDDTDTLETLVADTPDDFE